MATLEDFSPGDRVRFTEGPAIAYVVRARETEPDEDTEWSGIENDTGRLVVVAVGDDYVSYAWPEDLEHIDDDTPVCPCGQLGCGWHLED